MKALPIKPEEVGKKKQSMIPNEVIEAFNFFIAKKWNGYSSKFKQSEVISKILSLMGKDSGDSGFLFDNYYLDIDEVYIEQGWKVSYDRPGFNESYPATFTFTKRE